MKKAKTKIFFLILILNLASNVHGFCFFSIGEKYKIDPYLLLSIAKVESKFNPDAVTFNKNGSKDMGIMQINSSWLPHLKKYGITEKNICAPCVNIEIGAQILLYEIKQKGGIVEGVGNYNSKNKAKAREYTKKIFHVYRHIEEEIKNSDIYKKLN